MKCISCELEINPKWKHAIDNNVCPFCGNGIMEEHLKNLLTSLGEVMSKLQEYPQQLSDWMLSNYSFIKTDSENLINYIPKDQRPKARRVEDKEPHESKKFTVKVQTDDGKEEEVEAEKIQSEETTSEFFRRADAIKPNIDGFQSPAEKTQHLKKMAQQIRRAGTTSVISDVSEDSYDSEMMEVSELGDVNSLFAGNEIASSLGDSVFDDEQIPSVVLNMANRSKGNSSTNTADLLKFQKTQDRLLESRRNFESGNVGKGGFTRS